MVEAIKLSALVGHIQDTIQNQFEGRAYWVSTQITNVKKYEGNRRCYLTLEDYEGGRKLAELRAVFWSNTYGEIEKFEALTKQPFTNGIEIICKVKVRFDKVYGLNADVLEIDVAHTLGSLEIERQQTLERLLKENPESIQLFDGVYYTYNNRLPLPLVVSNIALITAPNSDGQRDFLQELQNNRHNYTFNVTQFLTTIQGNDAHLLIAEQLRLVQQSAIAFDAVAIVRGGGSQTDFKPFDTYELAAAVANFDVPVFAGIGHDRNQSIVDLMARQHKTPTKVAAQFIDHNFEFENQLMGLKNSLENTVAQQLQWAKDSLNSARRIVRLASPQAILNRGFAMLMVDGKIVTNPTLITENTELKIRLKDEIIHTTVTKKEHGNPTEL
jgi:exodeoxyribonuclease VII large subunit